MPNSIRDIRDTEENKASIYLCPYTAYGLFVAGGGGREGKEKGADS